VCSNSDFEISIYIFVVFVFANVFIYDHIIKTISNSLSLQIPFTEKLLLTYHVSTYLCINMYKTLIVPVPFMTYQVSTYLCINMYTTLIVRAPFVHEHGLNADLALFSLYISM